MPVPIPGLKIGSDTQKTKFLTIFRRPKTRFFDQISGVQGRAPLATNPDLPPRRRAAGGPGVRVRAPALGCSPWR